ncbi:hypothetical protein ABEB36_008299 [Hypothenemus hampei]|uniref:DUF8206 domain-containing protein n=1 Tax=Hypothenemus hampei TaxID=57062 RepID=A0ABD1EQH3_HYPHA
MSSSENKILEIMKNLNLNMDHKKEINILLLGETGVGKSTFINSVFNYLQFQDFEKAKKEKLNVLIPASFMVADKNYDMKFVQIGPNEDKNEDLTTGASATQFVKTYSFYINDGKTLIRLIDTPGMGDTRGFEADQQNCENILGYINRVHQLHAICYLMKAQQARITAYFQYCVTEIFSRLEKSASKNIIFVFTHSRGSHYGPDHTLELLKKIVNDIKKQPAHAEIPLDRNVFYFDNEAFQTLAAIKKGVEFSADVISASTESWKRSMQQCWLMFNYTLELTPHFVHNTCSVNEARNVISHLSQPMADIVQLVQDNIQILTNRENDLNIDTESLEELKNKLYIPVIDLKVIKLTEPVTVCTDLECTETLLVAKGITENHYKTRCHNPCYLQNVPKDIINSPELLQCACIGPDQNCTQCGHSYMVHMHVYYETEKKSIQKIDPTISQNIDTKEAAIENTKRVIVSIKQRKEQLENELAIIIRNNAKFAYFLSNNAITVFNDSYATYINYLIQREKSLGNDFDSIKLAGLERLLREHNEIKAVFSKAAEMQKKLGKQDDVTSEDISSTKIELFKLPLYGKKIKELYELQRKTICKEYTYTEYVHEGVFKKTEEAVKEKKKDNDKKKEKTFGKNRDKEEVSGSNRRRNTFSDMQRGKPTSHRNYQEQQFRRNSSSSHHENNHHIRMNSNPRGRPFMDHPLERQSPSIPPLMNEYFDPRGPPGNYYGGPFPNMFWDQRNLPPTATNFSGQYPYPQYEYNSKPNSQHNSASGENSSTKFEVKIVANQENPDDRYPSTRRRPHDDCYNRPHYPPYNAGYSAYSYPNQGTFHQNYAPTDGSNYHHQPRPVYDGRYNAPGPSMVYHQPTLNRSRDARNNSSNRNNSNQQKSNSSGKKGQSGISRRFRKKNHNNAKNGNNDADSDSSAASSNK